MAITSNSHLVSNLTSLIDPNKRSQQKVLQDQLSQKRAAAEKNPGEGTRSANSDVQRQELINANRRALKNLQDKLKSDNLEKLKAKFSPDQQASGQQVNLNHRENLGGPSPQSVSSRPGQIIDIRV